ncbi:Golgi to ER traffic protein 2 [Scheffersomyces coipomensis]|uniref:Golgi to ER traffic protein 2 n=1 Tax=Scheffersomyces coipomensis TaxID=1788519 RepID=UPI00315D2F0C
MSEVKPLSAEEKKRLLRERRAAKMAGGNATGRLNNILNQGSSVQTEATSVLDKENDTTSSTISTGVETSSTPRSTSIPIHHDDDPEIQDITSFSPTPEPEKVLASSEDIDAMFNKIFSGAQIPTGPDGPGGEDPFAQMLKMLGQPNGAGAGAGLGGMPEDLFNSQGNPFELNEEENQYQRELAAYNLYNHKKWKFRFLIIRFFLIFSNFFYHYITIPTFKASSYSFIRGIANTDSSITTTSFITYFTTIELITIVSYYLTSVKYDLFKTTTENNIFVKIISFGSMVLPQLEQYRPLLVRLLAYYELLEVILTDLSLVIVLFGLLSFL